MQSQHHWTINFCDYALDNRSMPRGRPGLLAEAFQHSISQRDESETKKVVKSNYGIQFAVSLNFCNF